MNLKLMKMSDIGSCKDAEHLYPSLAKHKGRYPASAGGKGSTFVEEKKIGEPLRPRAFAKSFGGVSTSPYGKGEDLPATPYFGRQDKREIRCLSDTNNYADISLRAPRRRYGVKQFLSKVGAGLRKQTKNPSLAKHKGRYPASAGGKGSTFVEKRKEENHPRPSGDPSLPKRPTLPSNNPGSFCESQAKLKGGDSICGLPTIYSALDLLGRQDFL